MSEELSDSSSSDSYAESNRSNISNICDIISWNSIERRLSQFKETFQQFSGDDRLFVMKSRCLSNNCGCNFKNYDILLAKVFVNFKLLIGKWSKLKFSKSTIPETDKLGTFIFFKNYQGFFEIMNENLEVIPFWSNVNQIIQNTPKSFIIRKDVKCLYIKEATDDPNVPHLFDNIILKAGTILSFSHSKKYLMKKGRKIKDQILVKCKDTKGSCFYLTSDEVVYSSPLAGSENISGAHTIDSIIEKFRFPINIKPLFLTPPIPNLPCTERHFLQLTERHQLDLIFITPITDTKRLFIITPALFDDHVFTIGEFLPSFISKHSIPEPTNRQIANHQMKIDDFFSKCHKYDSLSYLLKHSENISKVPQKFESVGISEFDNIYLEVDDIYFFIRNGYYPRNSIKLKAKKSEIKSESKPEEKVSDKSEPKPDEKSPTENVSTDSSTDSDQNSSIDTDDSSSAASISTSTESDLTSSTALKMSKQQIKKQAKSVPIINQKSKNKSTDLNKSQCHIDLSVDDMLNTPAIAAAELHALDGEPVSELANSIEDSKKPTQLPQFYQNQLSESQKFKISYVENCSLKNTAV